MSNAQSYSKQQTQNSATNQQVGAGTGGAAIGAGSSNNSINVTNTDIEAVHAALDAGTATAGAALAANTNVTDMALQAMHGTSSDAIGGIAMVAGAAGSVLEGAFGQFTSALSQSQTEAITAENNATLAAINVAANAAPQSDASLQEHLNDKSVLPGSQAISPGFSTNGHITVTEIIVILAVGYAAWLALK